MRERRFDATLAAGEAFDALVARAEAAGVITADEHAAVIARSACSRPR